MINKYCIANWKMNFNIKQGQEFISILNNKDFTKNSCRIVLCPSFTSLFSIVKNNKSQLISIGAQNIYSKDYGPYTGEISADMLNEIGVKFVILGHSERRHLFNETDELINEKVIQSIENNLMPIVCIGEQLVDRETEKTNEVLYKQIEGSLRGVAGKFILAYEPVWAIGTGKFATSDIIANTHSSIKYILKDLKLNVDVSLLYGGSVTADNASELSKVPNVDGFLIGGASLDVENFYSIYLNL